MLVGAGFSWSNLLGVDPYPDIYAKLALAVTSTQLAKQDAVEEFGIGEDLPFMFMGWRDDFLSVMLAFSRADMKLPVPQRIPKVEATCNVMRQAYWVDSITFVAEGFMSKAPWELKGKKLTEAFIAKDAKVTECMTASHVRFNRNDEPEVMLVSTPYNTVVGKHVVWGDQAAYSQGVGAVLQDAPILSVIISALSCSYERLDRDEQEELCSNLMSHGVNIQEFEPPASSH